ncbi:ornithine cyclodeaminase family protein [Ferribacterium limneticum]|uniref:ornithine cyclodeaminase family protein n=1 Tax=Ferribacterium limneticum TaxID=76259 RepID=UPI001CFC154E|nr:ornithine cyclodeaminase family protein [Ferribacterium limneticum]UCV29280.1 ornithine cyclodeaminase family protein [Ferribacterium limneticum]UCV33199.1 ornithine cyclodeaminase family protein [Ferribacterium limneticum]
MALFLSENDVKQILTVEMALAGVESAHRDLALGQALDTPRARTRLPQTALHILQGGLPAQGILGYKAYTSNRSGNRFLVHLFDAASGQLKAIIEADYLGMIRTGAASGVAAKWLAKPGSKIAGVFGAGWQAEGHVRAICAALPLECVKVFSRKTERLQAFCERLSRITGVAVVPAESAEATVRGSDLIGTVTTAAQPLFDAAWLEPGMHINAAGSNALIRQELSEAAVRRCDLLTVDAVPTALAEAGDLLPLLEKGRLHPRQLLELGDIIVGRHAGRVSSEQITLFESQGMAIQDLAVALRVLAAAEASGMGCELPI